MAKSSQEVANYLQQYGYTGNATGGTAQAFLDANPQLKSGWVNFLNTPAPSPAPAPAPSPAPAPAPTPAPAPQPSAPTKSQAEVENFLSQYGFSGSATGGRAQAFIDANPQIKGAWEAFASNRGEQPRAKTVEEYMSELIQNPDVPPEGVFTPTPHIVQQNELMTGAGTEVPSTQAPNAQQIQTTQLNAPTTVDPNTGQVDPSQALYYLDPNTGQYVPVTTLGQVPQAVAQQGAVSPEATVKGQLEQLYSESQAGMVPDWAKGAVKNANNVMAARGLAGSTIGTAAIAAAIQQSAIQIASPDAATYFQMDMANLNNRQQTELFNIQNQQQALLTDQAAQNAALQFNAANEQQTQQFMSTLVAGITSQNADRKVAIENFNAQTDNQFSQIQAQLADGTNKFNAQMKQTLDTFNAQLEAQRQQFNSQMQFAVEQSNVLWRRAANTGNTAAVNAANQANAQNAFNLSSASLNNLWQEYRDTASWLFTASENEKDRAFQMAYAANNNSFIEGLSDTDWTEAIGNFVIERILA